MPPKKKLCADNRQPTLTMLFGTNGDIKDDSSRQTDAQNDEVSITESFKKVRNFQPPWLKLYAWLRYVESDDTDSDYMYCHTCTTANKRNGLVKMARNRTYRKTTLSRHIELGDHKLSIETPVLQQNFLVCENKSLSTKNKAVMSLLKCVNWMACEDIPFNKYTSFIRFAGTHCFQPGLIVSKYVRPMGLIDFDCKITAD